RRLEPPSTRMHRICLAPELSATLSRDSCWIMVLLTRSFQCVPDSDPTHAVMPPGCGVDDTGSSGNWSSVGLRLVRAQIARQLVAEPDEPADPPEPDEADDPEESPDPTASAPSRPAAVALGVACARPDRMWSMAGAICGTNTGQLWMPESRYSACRSTSGTVWSADSSARVLS